MIRELDDAELDVVTGGHFNSTGLFGIEHHPGYRSVGGKEGALLNPQINFTPFHPGSKLNDMLAFYPGN
jgi:hypothetical protein